MTHTTCFALRARWIRPAVLLATAFFLSGCLTIPLGNPETAKIDDGLVGVWLNQATDGDTHELLAVMPYDARTYLVAELKYAKSPAGYVPRGQLHLKAWLTPIAGQTFVTGQLEEPSTLLTAASPAYVVGKITATRDTLTFQNINDQFVNDHAVHTAPDLAKLLAANVENPKLYDATVTTYRRAAPAEYGDLKAIFNAFADPANTATQTSVQEATPPDGL